MQSSIAGLTTPVMDEITEFQSLIDDVKAIHTEGLHNARWEVIICYHTIGKRIVTDPLYKTWGNRELLSRVTISTDIAERDLYRACQFYERYPDVNALPGGKSISWHKIVNQLLPGKTIDRDWTWHFRNIPRSRLENLLQSDDQRFVEWARRGLELRVEMEQE